MFKFRFPFVKASKYDKLIQSNDELKKDYQQLSYKLIVKNAEIDNIKDKLSISNKAINEVLPKLIKIIVNRNKDSYSQYCLTVHFYRELVYESFMHGNSREMIRYLSERIGKQVERELNTINFERL